MMSRAHPLTAYAAPALAIALTITLVTALATPAHSQNYFGGDRHGTLAEHPKSDAPAPAPSAIHSAPEPWPRLDPGAVLCKSAEDLQQRAMAINAALDGQNRALMTPGCSMVQTRLPVDVLDRSTLGRTQVRVRASGDTGWTDVWLPERPPGR